MASKHPLKVFISYASGDRELAQKLYDHLQTLGVDPWFDVEDLLPGQDWKMEISRALDETELILLCLSKKSVSKEGYVQKEMRLALDRALEIPPGEIFLIPCRFEDVDLPYSLRDFQWVDLYTESGMKKLSKSMSLRAEKIGAQSLMLEDAATPEIKKSKPAAKKRAPIKPASGGTIINISGNVSGSNIVIGDGNTTQNSNE